MSLNKTPANKTPANKTPANKTPVNKPPAMPETRCGYVALLGAPNAGKSTLLNQLVAAKVSIVSPKVQTTRARVLGIMVKDKTQIVFIDTPGLFEPHKRLERAMVQAAWQGAQEADLAVLIVDAALRKPATRALPILQRLQKAGRRVMIVLNKIDALHRSTLLPLAAELSEACAVEALFMVSALTGDGVDDLRTALVAQMQPGPFMYPEDQLADMSQRLLAAELTREKLFCAFHQELPYALIVETENWTQFRNGAVRIDQIIYVERESQRKILLGHEGKAIRAIRKAAQVELIAMLGCEVHLFVHVKVRAHWSDDPARYREMGLNFSA